MVNKISNKKKKIPKIPASEEREVQTKQHTKYEEEPVVKGKTHYSEQEIKEEEEERLDEE